MRTGKLRTFPLPSLISYSDRVLTVIRLFLYATACCQVKYILVHCRRYISCAWTFAVQTCRLGRILIRRMWRCVCGRGCVFGRNITHSYFILEFLSISLNEEFNEYVNSVRFRAAQFFQLYHVKMALFLSRYFNSEFINYPFGVYTPFRFESLMMFWCLKYFIVFMFCLHCRAL